LRRYGRRREVTRKGREGPRGKGGPLDRLYRRKGRGAGGTEKKTLVKTGKT